MNYKPKQRELYDVNGHKFNAKVDKDKYYTPVDLAKYCIDKTYEIIGKENITEIIEPSAGNGSFSDQIENCIAYDIAPEGENIIQQDFLGLDLKYKKGRLFIGNPPFGFGNNLALQFYKKCVNEGDYIAFILPASQFNNTVNMYEFDLIYSELISTDGFKDLHKNIKLTFNIYKRPSYGLNKKKKYKFEDFELFERRYVEGNEKRSREYPNNDYDFRICTWGRQCGKILNEDEHYANEVAFYIHNKDMKNKIRKVIENMDIEKDFYMTSTPNLSQWQIYEYLIKNIPELQRDNDRQKRLF